MAKLSRQDILKLARLARLDLDEDEIEQFRGEISEILAYVELLQSADIGQLQPTYQVSGIKSATREDKVENYGYSKVDLLKNVPAKKDCFIKVKRVL